MLSKIDHNGYNAMTLATKLSYNDYHKMLPILTYLFTKYPPTLIDKHGMSPLDYATYYYHPTLVTMLY